MKDTRTLSRYFSLCFIIFPFLLFHGSSKAQPPSFVKGIYVSITAEPKFVLYGDSSVNTLDCVDSVCKLDYIDGVCFKILWKDVKVDSSHGVMSFTIYKQELSQLMGAAISHHKAVALALYAGAFTPPSLISSMPSNHVLSNIHLAAQCGGPCHTDSIVTPNVSDSTYNIPVPWDKLYQANFQNIMRILNRYLVQNNISLSYIIFTGINEFSGETRLPNDIIQTRDSHGKINFFQNDYVLWKNAGYEGHTVGTQINQVRNTFDLFLNSIYNHYTTFRNTVLCVQSMGASSEFPEIPTHLPNAAFDDPKSLNYYACSANYDSTSDVFYDMLQDALNSKRPDNSIATMYCSLNEIYGTGLDYVGIVNNNKGNNTGLCNSFKAYHLRDVEFITGDVAPSLVNSTFVNNFSQSLTNGINAGAQLMEVFPYDIYATRHAKNSLKSQLKQALTFAHQQLTTASPYYNGYPRATTISDTLGKKDSIQFSIPALPGVVSYTWLFDGVSQKSGSGLLKFGLVKSLIIHGTHTVTVKYSSNCGTTAITANYVNGIPLPAVMQTELPDIVNDFTVGQTAPRNFTIYFKSPVEHARICVFNLAGQQVLNTVLSGSQFNFSLNSVSAGLYLVKVLAPENQINSTVKISVVR